MPATNARGARTPGHDRRAAVGLLLGAGAAVLALAGCSDDTSDSGDAGAGTGQEVCEQLTELRSDVETMRTMQPSDTVEDVRNVREDIAEEMDDVRDAAKEAGTKLDSLEAAYRQLDVTIDHLDRNMTGPAALDQVAPHVKAMDKAVADTRSTAGCDGT